LDTSLLDQVKETTAFLQEQGVGKALVGIILGTGLNKLVEDIEIKLKIPYSDIPNFPKSTVEFHKGDLIFGQLEDRNVLVMHGRFHFYEGHSMEELTFPIRVMKYLGVENLCITNASGCLNPNWSKGELMLINDHINLQSENPLRGVKAKAFGSIFTDLLVPYDNSLNKKLQEVAKKIKIELREGVYIAVIGPNLETRAEYRFLRLIGGDAVGMSTVPEVIVANQMQLPCCAISVLTDDCDPMRLKSVSVDDIVSTAQAAEPKLASLIKGLIKLC